MNTLIIRKAAVAEKKTLEALQWRASLTNEADRNTLLANPDAIELPFEQIIDGRVFIAEWNGNIAGFTIVLPRKDGDAELDGLFVEPALRRLGIARALVEHGGSFARGEVLRKIL